MKTQVLYAFWKTLKNAPFVPSLFLRVCHNCILCMIIVDKYSTNTTKILFDCALLWLKFIFSHFNWLAGLVHRRKQNYKMNWGQVDDVIMTSFMNKWIFVLDSVSDRKSNAFFIQLIFWNAQVNVEIRPSKRKAWDLNINFWYDTTIVRLSLYDNIYYNHNFYSRSQA